jgi:hypothetical protein
MSLAFSYKNLAHHTGHSIVLQISETYKHRRQQRQVSLDCLQRTTTITMEQAPVQIGQFILGKNLGIGAFGKVRT